MGYDSKSKGYRIYWPAKRTVSVERNVVFNENDVHSVENIAVIPGDSLAEGEKDKIIQQSPKNPETPEKSEETASKSQTDEKLYETHQQFQHKSSVPFPTTPDKMAEPAMETNELTQEYGCGKRVQPKPQGVYKKMNGGLIAGIATNELLHHEPPRPCEMLEDHEHMFTDLPPDFALISSFNPEPRSLDEALQGPNGEEWQKALEYKINQLERMQTWVVEDLPKGQMAIPCSEVLRTKQGPDGEVQSYHVRIVAGGHKQVEGVNYTETFSAAAKMPTICAVLANAAQNDWEIEHIDVKSAYLNASLNKTVYMKAPCGVLKSGQEGKVLRLLKRLYGLKQAGRGWNHEMSGVFMNQLNLSRSAADHSVFYQHDNEKNLIVAVATDDMAVTSKRAIDAERFKADVRKHWEIMDNGPIKWFLGFKIKRDQNQRTLSINQHAFIEIMTDKFRLTHAKPVNTPMDPGAQYSTLQSPSMPTQLARMQGVPYNKAIGSVLWPAVVSRPDIAYAVRILSQFIQSMRQGHWEALKRVISYLSTTKDLWLTFGGKPKTAIKGYSDADWARQKDRHLISGYAWKWRHNMELEETAPSSAIKHRVRIHSADSCCEGGTVAEEFF